MKGRIHRAIPAADIVALSTVLDDEDEALSIVLAVQVKVCSAQAEFFGLSNQTTLVDHAVPFSTTTKYCLAQKPQYFSSRMLYIKI